MKQPIELRAQSDNIVTLQTIRPRIGKNLYRKEILLLVTSDEGEDIQVLFNYSQAKSLLKALQELVAMLEIEQASSN